MSKEEKVKICPAHGLEDCCEKFPPPTMSDRFDERFKGWILQDNQECYRSFEIIKSFIQEEQTRWKEEISRKRY